MKKLDTIKTYELTKEEQEIFDKAESIVLDDEKSVEEKLSVCYEAMKEIGRPAYDLLGKFYIQNDFEAAYIKKNDFVAFLEDGQEIGNPYCAYILGRMYRVSGEFDKALECFKAARECEDGDAPLYWAYTYIEEAYDRVDLDKGIALVKEAVDRGSPKAAYVLGESYLQGGRITKGERDIRKAYEYLSIADTDGYFGASYYLGCIALGRYEDTPEDLLDIYVGRECMESGCSRLDDRAIREIGKFFRDGEHGYAQSRSMAGLLFKEAGMYGNDSEGAYLYGEAVRRRWLMDEEPDRAVPAYLKAMLDDSSVIRSKAKEGLIEYFNDPEIGEYGKADRIERLDVENISKRLDIIKLVSKMTIIALGDDDKKQIC